MSHLLEADGPIQTAQTTKPQNRRVQDTSNITVARYNPGTRDIHALGV